MLQRPSPRTDYVFDRFRLSADGTLLSRDSARCLCGRKSCARCWSSSSIAIKGHVTLPQFYAMMAEVLLLRGDQADAEHQLALATELMNARSDRCFAAEVHRLSAACRSMRTATGEAVQLLDTAIDVARSQGATTFELRAGMDLARHDPGRAREIVAAVLAALPEPEPWPDVVRATRLLAPRVVPATSRAVTH